MVEEILVVAQDKEVEFLIEEQEVQYKDQEVVEEIVDQEEIIRGLTGWGTVFLENQELIILYMVFQFQNLHSHVMEGWLLLTNKKY